MNHRPQANSRETISQIRHRFHPYRLSEGESRMLPYAHPLWTLNTLRVNITLLKPRSANVSRVHQPVQHRHLPLTTTLPAIACRVCLENVKKAAVLCAKCSLISHSKCAPNAPPTCDLRSQLLLYAHYAEQGNPASLYPMLDSLDSPRSLAAMSDVPYIARDTPRSSLDTPSPQPTHHTTALHASSPPTAFKFMAAFKRSRSSLTNEAVSSSVPASEPDSSDPRAASNDTVTHMPHDPNSNDKAPPLRRRQATVLQKRSKERPRSYTSNSTGVSSLRSAATAAESINSHTQPERLSQFSNVGNTGTSSSQERNANDGPSKEQGRKKSINIVEPSNVAVHDADTNDMAELSTASSVLPGSLPPDLNRRPKTKRDSKQSSNCIVQ